MINEEIKNIEDKRILNSMLSDFKEYENTSFAPSNVVWSAISNNFKYSIIEEGIGDVQSQGYNQNLGSISGFGSSITPGRTTEFDTMMWSLWNMLQLRDKRNIIEKTSPIQTTDNMTLNPLKVDGRPVDRIPNVPLNWDYLFALDTILSISEIIPDILTKSVSICELGAGWGRIAYYLSQINPKVRYHIFDIPTTLVVGYSFLSRNNAPIVEYEKTRNFNGKASKSPGISFMVSGLLEKVNTKQFDLFINQASFQEMELSQIEKYYEIINTSSDMFYSFQRYKDLVMEYGKYPKYDSWEVIFDRDCSFNPLWFECLYKLS